MRLVAFSTALHSLAVSFFFLFLFLVACFPPPLPALVFWSFIDSRNCEWNSENWFNIYSKMKLFSFRTLKCDDCVQFGCIVLFSRCPYLWKYSLFSFCSGGRMFCVAWICVQIKLLCFTTCFYLCLCLHFSFAVHSCRCLMCDVVSIS